MFSEDANVQISAELASAEAARSGGNEGKARVCARRAAGAAVREYLRLVGQPIQGSAYDLLGAILQSEVGLRVKEAAEHLRLRVDTNHDLPVGVDLIFEARILVETLEQSV
jgi:hypothetical protein